MLKAFITRHKLPERPDDKRVDVWFGSHIEDALYWETGEDAAIDCLLFNRGVEIPSSEGGTHICKNFKVEERPSGEFVISCEAPFIPKAAKQ